MNEKTTTQQIIKVHFFFPKENRSDFYFGSIKAIYAEFSPEEIGCKIDTLYMANISVAPKVTQKCIISRETVTRVANKKQRE